jgi:hypothetical protein
MNPDWSSYIVCGAAVGLGISLTLRKRANPDARILRPWFTGSLAISTLIAGILVILALLNGAAFREHWDSKSAIQLAFGFGLILQVVLTISGIILGTSVLYLSACRARNDLK